MKTGKKYIFITVIIIFIFVMMFFILNNQNKSNENITSFSEYTPQEEISTEQLRQTLITLYFKNKENNEIVPEARKIDSKLLVDNPYEKLIQLLIEGPKNENLESIIPKDTNIKSVKYEKGIVTLDFSDNFIKTADMGAEEEKKIINSIVNTLLELTEVKGIYILINGETDKCFESGEICFNEVFTNTI